MATRTRTSVELSGVHLCCQGCVNAANAALRSVPGVSSRCDMANRTVTLTADGDEAAREALAALAAAGFYGTSDNPYLTMKPVGDIPRGKVKHVKVSGIHNCCGPCCRAIQRAIAAVDGVIGDTAEPEVTTFEVTGEFRPADLIEEINAAGFSARVT